MSSVSIFNDRVSFRLMAAIPSGGVSLAQYLLVDLADAGLGDLVDDDHPVRHAVFRQLPARDEAHQVCAHLVGLDGVVPCTLHVFAAGLIGRLAGRASLPGAT